MLDMRRSVIYRLRLVQGDWFWWWRWLFRGRRSLSMRCSWRGWNCSLRIFLLRCWPRLPIVRPPVYSQSTGIVILERFWSSTRSTIVGSLNNRLTVSIGCSLDIVCSCTGSLHISFSYTLSGTLNLKIGMAIAGTLYLSTTIRGTLNTETTVVCVILIRVLDSFPFLYS